MFENSVYIAVGVASGVMTAFLLSIAGDFWTGTLLPAFRRWRYRGAHVSGEWKGLGTGPAPASGQWSELTLTLKQDARDLRASMILRDRSAGHSIDLNLRGTGTISDGLVTLSLWPASKASRCAATALLRTDAEGHALNGQLLYLDGHDAMEVVNVSVHRSGTTAAARLLPARSMPAASEASALVNG